MRPMPRTSLRYLFGVPLRYASDDHIKTLLNVCRNGYRHKKCAEVEHEARKRGILPNGNNGKIDIDGAIVPKILAKVEEQLRRTGLLERFLKQLEEMGVIKVEIDGRRLEIQRFDGCFKWTGEFEGWGCEKAHVVNVLVMFFAEPEVERRVEL